MEWRDHSQDRFIRYRDFASSDMDLAWKDDGLVGLTHDHVVIQCDWHRRWIESQDFVVKWFDCEPRRVLLEMGEWLIALLGCSSIRKYQNKSSRRIL